MPAEIPQFTKKQVAQAERREDFSHVVLTVIDKYHPQITQLAQDYSLLVDNQVQQEHIRQHYGFFADALVAAVAYTLQPLEIVAIWSRAIEVFSGYHRYALAGMIASAYAIQGVEHPDWRRFPRHYLETSQLPAAVLRDQSGLTHVMGRLNQIGESLDALDFYVYGTRESAMEVAAALGARINDGDVNARIELDKLVARQKEYSTPVLREIHENWGNGYTPLYFPVRDALETLQGSAAIL